MKGTIILIVSMKGTIRFIKIRKLKIILTPFQPQLPPQSYEIHLSS